MYPFPIFHPACGGTGHEGIRRGAESSVEETLTMSAHLTAQECQLSESVRRQRKQSISFITFVKKRDIRWICKVQVVSIYQGWHYWVSSEWKNEGYWKPADEDVTSWYSGDDLLEMGGVRPMSGEDGLSVIPLPPPPPPPPLPLLLLLLLLKENNCAVLKEGRSYLPPTHCFYTTEEYYYSYNNIIFFISRQLQDIFRLYKTYVAIASIRSIMTFGPRVWYNMTSAQKT